MPVEMEGKWTGPGMVEGEKKETNSPVPVALVFIEEQAAPGKTEFRAFPEALTAGAPSYLGEAVLEPSVASRAGGHSSLGEGKRAMKQCGFVVRALELNPLFFFRVLWRPTTVPSEILGEEVIQVQDPV